MSWDLMEAQEAAHRDEETIEVACRCTACGWIGDAEVYEGEAVHPCESCDSEGTLDRA